MDNIIRAVFCGSRYTTTKSAWLIDHGMVLKLSGVELPEVYEVDFSNSKTSAAKRVLGNADGVVIPDEYFLSKAQQIYAWVYLTTGDSGYTVLQVTIPLTQRPDVTDEPPTPQETDLIEQAIAALNTGVTRAETAADNAEAAVANIQQTVDDALQTAKDSGEFDGRDGSNGVTYTPTVDTDGVISWVNDGGLPNPQPRNIKGPAGKDGDVGATPNLTIGTVETLAPGADATAEITGTPENPVLNLGIPQGEQGEGADTSNLAPIIINSASGAIASFADGAENMPIKALTVNVEPVQDLHGYDSPWPAGGGKNLLQNTGVSKTENGITWTVNADGTISAKGTATANSLFVVNQFNFDGQSYVLNGCPPDGASSTKWQIQVLENLSGSALQNDIGGGVTITRTGNLYIRCVVRNGNTVDFVFKPMIRLSTVSDATYAPYSNICPISGWTGCEVWDDSVYGGTIKWNQLYPLQNVSFTGTNFTVTSARDGAFVFTVTATATNTTASNITAVGAGTFKAGHIYAFLGTKHGIQPDLKVYSLYADSVFKCGTPSYSNVTFVFDSLPAGTYRIYPMLFDLTEMFGETKAEEVLAMGSSAGAAYVKSLFPKDYYDYDVSYGETCVSAVNGDPYRHVTIQLGDTVYGGTLDVTGGKMVVDRAMVDLGTLNYSAGFQGYYTTGLKDLIAIPASVGDSGLLSSQFVVGNTAGKNQMYIQFSANYLGWVVFLPSTEYESAAAFKTAMSGVQLVYEIATPIEITLTPTQIETLLGTNNIWADAGPVDVDYRADTKLYIDNIHTPTDDDMTADAQIASGKYFLIGGNLYKSTTVIPAGDTIIPGTNCIKTNLAEALNALNA